MWSLNHVNVECSFLLCSVIVLTANSCPQCCIQIHVKRKLLSLRKCLTLCWLEKKQTLQAFLGSAATSQPTGSLAVGGDFIYLFICVCACVFMLHPAVILFWKFARSVFLVCVLCISSVLSGFCQVSSLELWFSWCVLCNFEEEKVCLQRLPQLTVTHNCLLWIGVFSKSVCLCLRFMCARICSVGGEPLWFPKTSRSGLIAFRQQSLLKEERKC